jgi:hypothetical protein
VLPPMEIMVLLVDCHHLEVMFALTAAVVVLAV